MSLRDEINNGYEIKTKKAYWDGKNFDELESEFIKYEIECRKVIRSYQSEVNRLKKLVEFKNLVNYRRLNSNKATLKRLKNLRSDYKSFKSQTKKIKEIEGILTQNTEWKDCYSVFMRAEYILRSLFGFEKLKISGDTTFNEIVFLSVGSQLDSFTKEHVAKRFGEYYGRFFLREIKPLIECGYIRRFEKKNRYYITTEGRSKFMSLIKIIYGTQYGLYWNGIFNK